jgi:hypothetical protein
MTIKIPKITKEVLTNDIRKSQDNIFDMLIQDKVINVLPEPVFREHFLPYFVNPLVAEQNNKIVAAWVGIAGTPMAEVNVVNPKGEVLFTVPPLIDSNIFNVVRKPRESSFQDIQAETQLRQSNPNARAADYFNESTSRRVGGMIQESPNRSINEQRWADIFQYYNIDNPDKAKQAQTSGSANSDLSDDFDYS